LEQLADFWNRRHFWSKAPGKEGGLYNARGRQVVPFPDDGHPTLTCAVRDLVGDHREEVIVWDFNELWVYTQNGAPHAEDRSLPTLPHEYNQSNYRSNVRLPPA